MNYIFGKINTFHPLFLCCNCTIRFLRLSIHPYVKSILLILVKLSGITCVNFLISFLVSMRTLIWHMSVVNWQQRFERKFAAASQLVAAILT